MSASKRASDASGGVGERLDKRLRALLMAKSPVYDGDRPEVRAPQLYQQGVMQVRMGDFRAAVNLFSRAIFLAPGEPLPFVARGEAFAAMCDFKSAIANLRKALSLLRDPAVAEDVRIRLAHLIDAAGVAHLRAGEPKRAMRFFDDAIRERPEKVFELHRCLAFVALERMEEAETSLIALLRVSEAEAPKSEPRAAVAATADDEGPVTPSHSSAQHADDTQQAEAAEEVRRAAETVDAEARVMLVHIYLVRGDFVRGRQMLEASLARHYNHPRVQDMEERFDTMFQRLRKVSEEALDVDGLTRCIACFPDDAELHRSRALAHVARKEYTLAVQDLFACLQKSGGSSPVASALMASTLATIADELAGVEDYVAAINYYTESLKWASTSIEVHVARGDCLVRLGKHEAALLDYKQALALDPTNVTVRQRLAALHDAWGMILYNQAKYDLAETEFTRAIAYDDEDPTFPYHRALVRLMRKEQLLAVRDLVTCRILNAVDPGIQKLIQQFCPAPIPSPRRSEPGNVRMGASAALIALPGQEHDRSTARQPTLATRLGLPLQAAHLLRGLDSEQLAAVVETEGAVKELRVERASLLHQTYAPSLIRNAVSAPKTLNITKEVAVDARRHGATPAPAVPKPALVNARVWRSSAAITDASRLDRVQVSAPAPVPSHLVDQRHRAESEARDLEQRAQLQYQAVLSQHCQQHQSGVAPPPPEKVARAKASRIRLRAPTQSFAPSDPADLSLALNHQPAPVQQKPQVGRGGTLPKLAARPSPPE